MLWVDPGVLLTHAWSLCLAEDGASSTRAIADYIPTQCFDAQRDFVLDEGKRLTALCPRQTGKTESCLFRLVRRMLLTDRAKCVFIAPSREQAYGIIWQRLKTLLEKLDVAATYREDSLECTFSHNGSKLLLLGAADKSDINRCRGQQFDSVIIDEAGVYPGALLNALVHEVIEPALNARDGDLVLAGTANGYCLGPFYEITRTGSISGIPYRDRDTDEYQGRDGWSCHHWTMADGAVVPTIANVYRNALLDKARQGMADDDPRWLRERCAVWARDNSKNVYVYRAHDEATGAEWNRWDPPRDADGWAVLPTEFSNWLYAVGFDVGYEDPCAVVVLAWSFQDPQRRIFQVHEFSKRGLNTRAVAQVFLGPSLNIEKPVGGILGKMPWPEAITGDVAGSGKILLEDLRTEYGLQVDPAPRAGGDKITMQEVCNGLLAEGRLKVLKDSALETQLTTLQLREDESRKLSERKGERNDAADACLYALRGVKHFDVTEATVAAALARPEPKRRGDLLQHFALGTTTQPDDDLPPEQDIFLDDAN